MENKETMNLQQKLIAISNEMPKLLKKHYSDEVDYDFVKIDDIFELLNLAFTKHHICLQELEETDAAYSKVDGSWIYTAKLTFFYCQCGLFGGKRASKYSAGGRPSGLSCKGERSSMDVWV